MKVKTPYDKSDLPTRVFSSKRLCNDRGYVPVADRIKQMVQLGLQIQKHPYYQFTDMMPDNPITVNRRNLDLNDIEQGKKEFMAKSVAANQEASRLAQEARSKAEREKIISEYLASKSGPTDTATTVPAPLPDLPSRM